MSIVCDLSEFAGPKREGRKEPDPIATADEVPPIAHALIDGPTQLERELDELRKARTFWRERAEGLEHECNSWRNTADALHDKSQSYLQATLQKLHAATERVEAAWASARAALAQEPATEPQRHLTRDEQAMLSNALRKSARQVYPPTPADDLVRRLRADAERWGDEMIMYDLEREAAAAIEARDQTIAELRQRVEMLRDIKPCCQKYETCTERCAPLTTHWRDRAAAAEAKLLRIITAYDEYRGRGVAPAPREYRDVVIAIDAARKEGK